MEGEGLILEEIHTKKQTARVQIVAVCFNEKGS